MIAGSQEKSKIKKNLTENGLMVTIYYMTDLWIFIYNQVLDDIQIDVTHI